MIKFICVVFALNSVFCIENDLDEPVEQCGIMSASSSLIQGGQRSSAETFPWIASVLTRYQGATLYAGSGSLISDRHVLCAANSVAYENYLDEILNPKQNYIAYESENVAVILGSTHYKDAKKPGALHVETKQVILHPDLAGARPRVFNIAIIVLRDRVTFSKTISPICLKYSYEDQDKMLGKTVFAVGFGVDQDGVLSKVKKHIPMAVVDSSTCEKFFNETMQKGKATRFFCARGNGLETPCRYDKPLYIKQNDRWFLQAMSSTFKVFKDKTCRPRAPVLYEDMTTKSIINWITSKISQQDS